MDIKQMPPPGSSSLAVVIAIALLHISSFLVLSADAASPWVEAQPPGHPEVRFGLHLIHFMDAGNG
jgi:hypothetical protein